MFINTNVNNNIVINNESIEIVEEIKYLGVILDNKLKFDKHIENTCAKIAKKLYFFRRIRNKISINCAINIYNVIIKPHFEYCATILFLGSNVMLTRLQKLQNRGMRIILKCNILTHIRDMLDALRWLSVNQRVKLNVLVFIFRIKNNMLPRYLSSQIQYVAEVQPYYLRNNQNFRIPFRNTNYAQNTLMHKGLKLFNDLPTTIKNTVNLKEFKRNVTFYIRENYE